MHRVHSSKGGHVPVCSLSQPLADVQSCGSEPCPPLPTFADLFAGPPLVQLSLDLSTPLEVVEMLRGAVDAHVKANSAEFTGSSSGAAECSASALLLPCLSSCRRPACKQQEAGTACTGMAVVLSRQVSRPLILTPADPRHALPSSVHVRALGDPMKLAISVWYEFCHNGVDGGRISRARWAGRHSCSCSLLVLPSVLYRRWSEASEGSISCTGRQCVVLPAEALL